MSRIMILGAGRGQVDLIRCAKQQGHTAIVASIPGAYPGFAHADEICYVDITDPKAVEKEVLSRNIQGITTCCMDTAMETFGYLCEKFRFPGISWEAGKTARDKLLMKDKFIAHGVRTARYVQVSCKEDLLRCCETLAFPMIVKAVDQQGSKGIHIAENTEELLHGWEATMSDTGKDYCIVEKFLSGSKHGANGCVIDGKIIFFLASEDITEKTAVLGHIFPFDTDSSVLEDIRTQSFAAVRALGLNNCIFNVDYILHEGQVYIIEATGRMGANGIPELLSIYYQRNIYEILIQIACGKTGDLSFLSNEKGIPCCSKMLISHKEGILKEIIMNDSPESEGIQISYFIAPGDRVSVYRSARDCVGQLIMRGSGDMDWESEINRITKKIDFILEET